ncbi:hypothetical protein OF83DRAFT_1089359 [Amylostereum chailletii]|nr:hypothetical protein OF83DRAFT_1089359 [Amylostereum chailletii]
MSSQKIFEALPTDEQSQLQRQSQAERQMRESLNVETCRLRSAEEDVRKGIDVEAAACLIILPTTREGCRPLALPPSKGEDPLMDVFDRRKDQQRRKRYRRFIADSKKKIPAALQHTMLTELSSHLSKALVAAGEYFRHPWPNPHDHAIELFRWRRLIAGYEQELCLWYLGEEEYNKAAKGGLLIFDGCRVNQRSFRARYGF